jgi:group I intron endonuclease
MAKPLNYRIQGLLRCGGNFRKLRVISYMEIYGRIYLITNLKTSKQYVGKTTKTLEQRFKKHVRDAFYPCRKNKTYFNNTIAKYGVDSFKIEELDSAKTPEELSEKESEYILLKNTLYPNGYNLIIRGNNLNIVTDLIREKCAAGGRKGWENTRKSLQKMQKRKESLAKAGAAAGIKNRERRGLKPDKPTTSKYVGVRKKKQKNKYGKIYFYWEAQYRESGRKISKTFKNEEDAARFYDENMKRLYGANCRLNF